MYLSHSTDRQSDYYGQRQRSTQFDDGKANTGRTNRKKKLRISTTTVLASVQHIGNRVTCGLYHNGCRPPHTIFLCAQRIYWLEYFAAAQSKTTNNNNNKMHIGTEIDEKKKGIDSITAQCAWLLVHASRKMLYQPILTIQNPHTCRPIDTVKNKMNNNDFIHHHRWRVARWLPIAHRRHRIYGLCLSQKW